LTRRQVFFFGDSHTAGVGDPSCRGWPGRVIEVTERVGQPITAHYRATSGDTSNDVLRRCVPEVDSGVGSTSDCRVVLSFGLNDALRHGPTARRRAPKQLGHLLDELSSLGVWAFVVGPCPIDDREGSAHLGEISRRFLPVCQERNVPYAPVFDQLIDSTVWNEELSEGDGVHPGRGGYDLLASLIIERGLVSWLIAPSSEPQGLPHRRFAPDSASRSKKQDNGHLPRTGSR
jgi:acyl-CoA thioesterase I